MNGPNSSKGMTPLHCDPVDKLAARVVYARGIHWFPDAKSITQRHSKEFPLAMRPPLNRIQRELIGKRCGRLKVIGVAAHQNPKKNALYVCQCDCGAYEHRRSAAINNPNNYDACTACRLIAQRRRHLIYEQSGKDVDPTQFLGNAAHKGKK